MTRHAEMAKNRTPGIMTAETAAKAVPHPLRPGIARALNLSDSRPIPFLARLIDEQKAFESRQQSQVTISNQFQATLDRLAASAQSEQLSQRKLAARIGIPERTFRRLAQGTVSLERAQTYLPKLEAAVNKLLI